MFSAARGPLPVQALASAQRTFEIKPVTLPLGRGRLTTKPLPTGLLSAFREESGRQSTEPHYNRLRTNRSGPSNPFFVPGSPSGAGQRQLYEPSGDVRT